MLVWNLVEFCGRERERERERERGRERECVCKFDIPPQQLV